jgi:hypothetical protein
VHVNHGDMIDVYTNNNSNHYAALELGRRCRTVDQLIGNSNSLEKSPAQWSGVRNVMTL